jgi:hypothetical protein
MTFDVVSWPMLVLALAAFGFAPGLVLRLIVLTFPRHDPRRQELLGELYAVPRFERPFWVAEQLEVALFEGLRGRFIARRAKGQPTSPTSASKRKPTSQLNASSLLWRGSTFNAAIGGGVEVAHSEGKVFIRNARDTEAKIGVYYSPSEWQAFIKAAKMGEFDRI